MARRNLVRPRIQGGYGITAPELKPKDLMGMPWRLAFALQAAGWYLRRDIVWHKPNPMPESVNDRPTTAHEYLFLMTRSERYYYDADAIAEPATSGQPEKPVTGWVTGDEPHDAVSHNAGSMPERFARSRPLGDKLADAPERDRGTASARMGRGAGWRDEPSPATRNARSVWTIPTQAYAEAHFATFPEALVEPCILAGSRAGDTVLDPFMGSGTVGLVADRLGRHSIWIELNPAYAELARNRVASDAPLLTCVTVENGAAVPASVPKGTEP